ncbi:MAG: hypothetical protein N3A38_15690, partial [Planctomycetota bacterium]|nr:hypothetical protein [Planctomycetota bacterium]
MAAEAAVALAGWMFGAAAAMAGAADPAPASPEQSSGRKRILTEQSIWRSFVMRQGEVFRLASGEDKALDARGAPTAPPLPPANPPPPDWMKPDFDDSGWQRRKGVVLDLPADSSMLCLRGRFEVADPGAAGDLRLDMSFIGGAVVYLNGREIARRRLPAGELKPDTPADPYPDEAYLRPDGFLYANFFGDPEKFKDRLRVRYRSLSGVRLPADGLVKGVNVLAIGLYRAPASELLLTKKPAMWNRESWRGPGLYWWTRVGLESLMLSAPADAAGVVSNVGCPPGFRVWTHPVCSVVPQDAHAEAISSIRPVTMTTGRNGFAAGQIVAAAREDIRGLKVALGEFRTPDGKSRIPASAAGLLYAVPDASLKGMFNALLPAPPESVPAD